MSIVLRRYALTHWMWGATASEDFAKHFLAMNGCINIVPQAPLGGPDGGRDIKFDDGAKSGVAAAYFPPFSHPFKDIESKFISDFSKAQRFKPALFVFITGQHLTVDQRDSLINYSDNCEIRIFDVHALSHLLIPIFSALGLDISEYIGQDPSVKVLEKIILSCYFWDFPKGWESAISSFEAEVLEIDALERVVSAVDFDLPDTYLDQLLTNFVSAWRTFFWKLIEKYDLRPDHSGVTLNIPYDWWREEYEKQVWAVLYELQQSYAFLKNYVISSYPELIFANDLSSTNDTKHYNRRP